jgi:hypothetical protein
VGLLNETHPRLDFDRLEQWIRETMGDPELSGKIRGVIQEDMGDQLRTLVEYIGKALLVDNTRFCKYKQTLFLTRFSKKIIMDKLAIENMVEKKYSIESFGGLPRMILR